MLLDIVSLWGSEGKAAVVVLGMGSLMIALLHDNLKDIDILSRALRW